MTPKPSRSPAFPRLFALCLLSLGFTLAAFAAGEKKTFDVPAGDAVTTLKQAAQQGGVQIMFPAATVQGVKTNAVQGELVPREALDRMLADTGLMVVQDDKTGALAVKREGPALPNAPRVAQAEATTPKSPSKVESGKLVLDKFEVLGSKSINADIPRTRDDVQPYVVFGRDQIQNSQATNIDEFLRTRLPMNQSSAALGQTGQSAASQVSLRGLSTAQTMILVDGRRQPSIPSGSGTTIQADLNGIPLDMIERIEVLPSTASGIYGGGALGGVINVITRKDYSGVDLRLNYINTFEGDAASRRVDLSGSVQLEDGKTMLTFNVSRLTSTTLTVQDRDLQARARALLLANNPAAFFGTATPPIGYTTNIRSQNGLNLVLKPQYGGTALNSAITFVPVGYAGTSADGGAALAANAGKYNLDLPDSIAGRRSGLLSTPDVQSFGLSLRRRFGSWLEVMLDGNRLQNTGSRVVNLVGTTTTLSAAAPNNPFTTPVTVAFPATAITAEAVTQTTTSRLLAGLVVRLPARWSAGLDYVWAQTEQNGRVPQAVLGDPDGTGPGLSYTAALAAGTLNVMRDLNVYPLDYTAYLMPDPMTKADSKFRTDEVTLRGSGPLFRLPAGEAALSVSALYRYERTPGNVRSTPSTASPAIAYSYEPTVGLESRAYTAELNLPVFAAGADASWRRSLDLQLAVRRDEGTATVRGSSETITVAGLDGPFPGVKYVKPRFADTTATAGFKYSPVKDITVRGSWGTGFLMPAINQLTSSAPTFGSFTITDPKRNNVSTNTPFLSVAGGNPNLKPEESESLSGGVILTPRFLPGFRLSLDYTRITKTNEIGGLGTALLFTYEDVLPGNIIRAPLTDADRALGYTGGEILQIDGRTQNLAGKKLTAYDLQADYTWRTASRGEWQFYAMATYQPDFSTQALVTLPYVQTAGTLSVLKWRGNGGVNWTSGRWSLGWNMQYYDSYFIYTAGTAAATIASQVLNQGSPTIPSQTYHDVQVRYKWGAQPTGWQRYLAHTELSVGVQNIFNTRPPPLATTSGSGGSYSTFGDPRLSRYGISLRKHF